VNEDLNLSLEDGREFSSGPPREKLGSTESLSSLVDNKE
jgi:hypothetical protein